MVLGRALVGFRSLLASAFLVAFFGFGCLSPLSIRMIVLFGWLWLLLSFGPAGILQSDGARRDFDALGQA